MVGQVVLGVPLQYIISNTAKLKRPGGSCDLQCLVMFLAKDILKEAKQVIKLDIAKRLSLILKLIKGTKYDDHQHCDTDDVTICC